MKVMFLKGCFTFGAHLSDNESADGRIVLVIDHPDGLEDRGSRHSHQRHKVRPRWHTSGSRGNLVKRKIIIPKVFFRKYYLMRFLNNIDKGCVMIFLCLIKFDLRTCCLTVFPMSKNFRSSIKRKLYLAEISFKALPDSGVQSLTCKRVFQGFQQSKLILIKVEFITSDM